MQNAPSILSRHTIGAFQVDRFRTRFGAVEWFATNPDGDVAAQGTREEVVSFLRSMRGVWVPIAVGNVNTVQDACKRLRAAIDLSGPKSDSARRARHNLRGWIDHALESKARESKARKAAL